jgi:ABC-2 type transport system permease protein
MTFLQRTLGRNYKLWYISKFHFKAVSVYFWSDLFWFLGQATALYTAILIWYFNNADSSIYSYILIGSLILSFTNCTNYWPIGYDIKGGKITRELLVPMSFFTQRSLQAVGFYFKNLLYNLIIYLPMIIFLGKFFVFYSLTNFVLTLIFIPIIYLSKLAISITLGCSAFFTIEHGGTCNFYENIFPIASGLVFGLEFLKSAVWFYPFSYFIYHPVQIYLGKYDTNQIIQTFAGGIIWCLVLWILARLVFKAGLKKNEAVGL